MNDKLQSMATQQSPPNQQDAATVSLTALVDATKCQAEQFRLISSKKQLVDELKKIDKTEQSDKQAATQRHTSEVESARSTYRIQVSQSEKDYRTDLNRLENERKKSITHSSVLRSVSAEASTFEAKLLAHPDLIPPYNTLLNQIKLAKTNRSNRANSLALTDVTATLTFLKDEYKLLDELTFDGWPSFIVNRLVSLFSFGFFQEQKRLDGFLSSWEAILNTIDAENNREALMITSADQRYQTAKSLLDHRLAKQRADADAHCNSAVSRATNNYTQAIFSAEAKAANARNHHSNLLNKWRNEVAALDLSVSTLSGLGSALSKVRSGTVLSKLAIQPVVSNASISGICLGQVLVSFDRPDLLLPNGIKKVPIPIVYPIAHDGAICVIGGSPEIGRKVLSDMVLQVLASVGPENVQLTLFDAIKLGDTFSILAPLRHASTRPPFEHILTSSVELETKLEELEKHIVHVTQNYLSQGYATLREYNIAAPDVAEQYKVVVISDVPANMSRKSLTILASIVQNGPRCGVLSILYVNSQSIPTDVDLSSVLAKAVTIECGNDCFVTAPYLLNTRIPVEVTSCDEAAGKALVNSCVTTMKQIKSSAIDLGTFMSNAGLDLASWWKAENSDGIELDLGRSGVRGIQTMVLGASGTVHHALIVGTIGSGKSNLLHTIITACVARYSPKQVELVLVDFKQGTEFRIYKDRPVPHLRVLAIAGEREFGLSALRDSSNEMTRRAELFKSASVTNIKDYRQAGFEMPRRLVLLDEYQVLFEVSDEVADEARDLIRKIVREGRAFGVHLLMASQTLSGTSSLTDDIRGNIEARVALAIKSDDAREVFGPQNTGASLINRPGQGIYNDKKGETKYNQMFQAPLVDESTQRNILGKVLALESSTRQPIIFDGSDDIVINENQYFVDAVSGLRFPPKPVVWPGQPVAIAPPVSMIFNRQPERNLLIVDRDVDRGGGMLANLLLSLILQTKNVPFRIQVIDASPEDSRIGRWLESIPLNARSIGRIPRSELEDVVISLEHLLERRSNGESITDSFFFVIAGASRVRDLRGEDGHSSELAIRFRRLLSRGPDYGIHTVFLTDSMAANDYFLRTTLGFFGMRLFASSTADETRTLGEGRTSPHIPKGRFVCFDVESSGGCPIVRPYAFPNVDLLTSTLGLADGKIV